MVSEHHLSSPRLHLFHVSLLLSLGLVMDDPSKATSPPQSLPSLLLSRILSLVTTRPSFFFLTSPFPSSLTLSLLNVLRLITSFGKAKFSYFSLAKICGVSLIVLRPLLLLIFHLTIPTLSSPIQPTRLAFRLTNYLFPFSMSLSLNPYFALLLVFLPLRHSSIAFNKTTVSTL